MTQRNGEAPAWRVGDVIDGLYEVTRVHEAGGMGLVYRVTHRRWGTDLAVKSPRPELFRSARDRELFTAEAETWVGLGLHPHVCVCHYVREIDGTPRVFAEYIDGGSLREHIQDGRLYRGGPQQALVRILDLAVQTAWGLQHAHQQGLVHQDMKPGNVLLDRGGTARITDFGLARAGLAVPGHHTGGGRPGGTAADTSLLVTSGGMTRAYASPEQFEGRQLGRRSDLYSFAVSVLEMFTGGIVWYAGPVAAETLAARRSDPGHDGRPPIPPAVADLLDRCLRHDPADRPGSMAEVAAELTELYRQLTGTRYPRPAPAAAEPRADELNNRALSLFDLKGAAAAQEAFAAARQADPRHLEATYNSGLLRWWQGESTDEELVTDLETLRAAGGDTWQARYLLAQVHLERGDLDAARALLDAIETERPGEPEVRAARAALISGDAPDHRAAAVREVNWHPTFNRPFRLAVRLTPDGWHAFSGHGSQTGRSRGVRLWDLHSGAQLRGMDGLASWLSSVDVSADGRHAISAGPDNEIRFWDLAAGRSLLAFTPPGPRSLYRVQSVRLDAAARTAVAVVDGRLWSWDFPSGKLRRQLGTQPARHDDDRCLVELDRGGTLALVSSRDRGSVQLWDLKKGRLLHDLAAEGQRPTAIWLEPEGRVAATASPGLTLRLWDTRSGRCVRTLTAPIGEVHTLSLSGNSRYAVTGGEDGAVRIWDLALHRCLRTFRGHGKRVAAVRMGLDADWALSAGEDNTARRWQLRPETRYRATLQVSRPRPHSEVGRAGEQARALLAEAEQARAAGRHAAALELLTRARAVPGHERAPEILAAWRALGGHARRTGLRGAWPVHVLAGQTAPHVFSVAISADGRTGVTGSGGGPVRLWDLTTGTRLPDLPKPLVGAVGLSTDGTRAVASGGGELRSWALPGERPLGRTDTIGPDRRSEAGEEGSSTAVAFSADARLALAISRDRALRLWDVDGGRCLRVLTGHRDRPTAVHLSADGTRAVSGGRGGEILLRPRLDTEPLRLTHPVPGPLGEVGSVALSADGRRMLSTGAYGDRTLRLWDADTGEHLRQLAEPAAESMTVRLSSDGRFAFAGGRDGAVRIWDTVSGRLLRELEGHRREVWSVAVTPDARFLLSGASDGTARLWELDWELETD